MRICIAGGSGFLGRNLAEHLVAREHEVVVCSRSVVAGPWRHARWDGRSLGPWTAALEGCDALVNLAGRSVDCIKTPEHCDEILRSRVESTRVLGGALRTLARPPRVWVQMSTAHIYGDPPDLLCEEDAAFGHGLAPEVGQAWEAEHRAGLLPGMRSVILRTSFVLGRGGGALPRLVRLARWGLGGRIGHGRQGISWIHEQDLDRLFVRALADEGMEGAYLATAPEPVANRHFMAALRRAVGMPIGLPAPAWLVRLGAPLVMRSDPELAILGRYCRSRRLADEGFEFRFPALDGALRDLFSSERE